MKTATRWVLRSDMTRAPILTVACIATVVLIAAVWLSARIPGAVTNVHAQEDRGCSVASLKGTYAFRRTGMNNVLGGPIAQIGIAIYDGDGTRDLIRTTRSANGVILDWHDDVPPRGSYTVDPDCTGALFEVDGTKSNNLVVLDGGKGFFLLSTAPGTITTEEGKRLEVED
jgi:hypothetical protein